MTKKRFLAGLSDALKKLIPEERDKYISYYDEAISDLIENGVSEAGACQRQGSINEIAEAILREADKAMLRKRDIMGILLCVFTIVFSLISTFCLLIFSDSGAISLIWEDTSTSIFFAGKSQVPAVLLIVTAVLTVVCALYAVIKRHKAGIIIGIAALLCFGGSFIFHTLRDKRREDEQRALAEQDGTYVLLENQEEVEQRTGIIVSLVSDGDYDTFSERYAAEELKPYLNAEDMDLAKSILAEDWGNYQFMGNVYAQEVTQNGVRYIVAQVTVTYENVSVVYTINYDENLAAVGIYMR